MTPQIECTIERIPVNSKLPADVMAIILAKLPVQSLLRFKAVSKPWHSFIESPRFIKMHLPFKSLMSNHLILFITEDTNETEFPPDYSLLSDNHAAGDDFSLAKFPLSFPSMENQEIHILDSCNGLLCLFCYQGGYNDNLILWNPAIRKYRFIKLARYCNHFSLGFVESTNDYKIVGFTNRFSSDDGGDAWIYTLSLDSWKKLDRDYDSKQLNFEGRQQTFVNGSMHFHTGNGKYIAAFDVANEVMRYFAFPDKYNTYQIWREVVAIRGYLTVVVYPLNWNVMENGNEIWVMKEYGNEGSWFKQSNIQKYSTSMCRPLCSWKDEEIVFRWFDENCAKMMFYDPYSKAERWYDEDRPIRSKGLYYVETLESVEGGKRCSCPTS